MKLLTVKEVAALLGVSPQTVYLMLKRNELPAFRVGSQWRFDSDKLALWTACAVNSARDATPAAE